MRSISLIYQEGLSPNHSKEKLKIRTKNKMNGAKGIVKNGKRKKTTRNTGERGARYSETPESALRRTDADFMIAGLGRKGRIAVNRVIEVLISENGMITYAAKRLGVSYYTLRKFIWNNTKVQEALQEVEECNLDKTEIKLHKLIDQGNLSAIIFFLKNKGKRRGFGDPARQLVMPTQPITFKYKLVLPKDYPEEEKKKYLSSLPEGDVIVMGDESDKN